jgi:hypothetical protein
MSSKTDQCDCRAEDIVLAAVVLAVALASIAAVRVGGLSRNTKHIIIAMLRSPSDKIEQRCCNGRRLSRVCCR